MSYCNQPASLALRDVEFYELCHCFYMSDPDDIFGIRSGGKQNYNYESHTVSAPDHLQAADWLAKNHQIFIWFCSTGTIVSQPNEMWFFEPDHRDRAIIAACEIIKERNKNNK